MDLNSRRETGMIETSTTRVEVHPIQVPANEVASPTGSRPVLQPRFTWNEPVGRRGDAEVPSPSEIRAACAEIQRNWTDKERRRRSGVTRLYALGKQCCPSSVSLEW